MAKFLVVSHHDDGVPKIFYGDAKEVMRAVKEFERWGYQPTVHKVTAPLSGQALDTLKSIAE
jgi:hypothetical protein